MPRISPASKSLIGPGGWVVACRIGSFPSPRKGNASGAGDSAVPRRHSPLLRAAHHLSHRPHAYARPTLHCLLPLAVAGSLAAQDSTRADRFTLRDIFALEWAADPQISPDGKRIVFVRAGFDIMKDNTRSALWIVNSDGTELRPLLEPARQALESALVARRHAAPLRVERGGEERILRPLDGHRRRGDAHAPRGIAAQIALVARRQVRRVHDVRARRAQAVRHAAQRARGRRLGAAHDVHRSTAVPLRRTRLSPPRARAHLRPPRGGRHAAPGDGRRLR